MSSQAVKMTVDWMFQGQGNLLHSILIRTCLSIYFSSPDESCDLTTLDTVTSTTKETSTY